MNDAWSNAIMNGHATEDDSAGYTLTNDPKARRRNWRFVTTRCSMRTSF